MDYYSRIIFATFLGLAAGIGIGYFLGSQLFWVVLSVAVAIATDAALRTTKNVKGPKSPLKNLPPVNPSVSKKIARQKPPSPRF